MHIYISKSGGKQMSEINLADIRGDIEKLLKYIPWLESKSGESVQKVYSDNNLANTSVPFPVYDSTLLSFVNEANATSLMDKNYVYVYSHHFIRDVEDEKKAIDEAGVKDGDVLCGILSKYILSGMVKGNVWSLGVTEGIYLRVLKKMKSLLEIWDAPLA